MFFVVEMTAQTRMPGGNFRRAFCFNSVKIIFLYSMSCQIGQTPEQFRKFDFSELMCKGTSPFCGTQQKAHPLSSPLECCDQTQTADCCYKYSVGNFSTCFSLIFLCLLNSFFCAKECYKQTHLENRIKHRILTVDNFKRQR